VIEVELTDAARHDLLRLRDHLRASGDPLSGKFAELEDDATGLAVQRGAIEALGGSATKLTSMRLEVLRKRRMEDLLRRPPRELGKQAERCMVNEVAVSWRSTRGTKTVRLVPLGRSHANC
jgi:hypothetical protein